MKKIYSIMAAIAAMSLSAQAADQAAYAYLLKAEGADNNYTVSFNVNSEAATTASLVLTDSEGNTATVELGAVQKGANSFKVSIADLDLALGEIAWAVEVNSTIDAEEPVRVLAAEVSDREYGQSSIAGIRGGVCVINNPEYDTYGMAVVTMMGYTDENGDRQANGVRIIDQELNVTSYLKGDTDLKAVDSSFRPVERYGKVVISSYSDKFSGLYTYDLATPDVAPVQMVQGDRDSDGLFWLDGEALAGSNAACGVSLDGTQLVELDEDLCSNKLAIFDLGESEEISAPPTKIGEGLCVSGDGPASIYNHTANSIIATPYGYMISQVRWANGDTYPSFVLYDADQDKTTFTAGPLTSLFVSSTGGIALNKECNLLAFAGYTGNAGNIYIYPVTWDENEDGDVVPTFEEYTTQCTLATAASCLCYDPAGNLYVYANAISSNANAPYEVWAFPGEHKVSTPAKTAEPLVKNSSSLISISANDVVVPAVYYNLNGQVVDGSNLGAGVYVKLQGNKATKVVVK